MQEIFEAQRQLLRNVMQPGTDYGPIPGTTTDRMIFKAGAEKLLVLFGYAHEMVLVDHNLDWETPFFFYRYRCDIYDRKTGALVGQAYGWVTKSKVPPHLEPESLPQRKSTRGWTLYRINNPEIADLVNTIDKMAQKRAFVGAVRVCTAASGLFAEEGVPPADERNGAHEPELPEAEEVEEPEGPAQKQKPKGKESPNGKLEMKVKLLFNKANAALQEAGLPAHYRTSEHSKNTLHSEGGLTDQQILATSEESLINLLVKHAKEATK